MGRSLRPLTVAGEGTWAWPVTSDSLLAFAAGWFWSVPWAGGHRRVDPSSGLFGFVLNPAHGPGHVSLVAQSLYSMAILFQLQVLHGLGPLSNTVPSDFWIPCAPRAGPGKPEALVQSTETTIYLGQVCLLFSGSGPCNISSNGSPRTLFNLSEDQHPLLSPKMGARVFLSQVPRFDTRLKG